MKISVKFLAALLAVGLLSGCATGNKTTDNTNLFCAISGGVIGSPAGPAGSAVGAIAGFFICPEGEDTAPMKPMAAVAPLECTDVPPPGALLDAQGCAYDSDGDGVVDGVDMCASTPAGVSVDIFGCALDSDRDGVADYQDLCPGTPLGTIVNPDGCPLPGQNLLSLTGVNFDTNKAVLSADAKSILEQAVTLLKKTDSMIDVRVEGHTDSRGADAHNMTLSQSRAEAVVSYLVSQGVNGARLLAVGMGEGYPVANNDTSAGQAANRRVDFVVSN
ncbi:thrombospondin [Methylophaga sp. 42_25_T18]|nr:thrombospondin [Methylophaga sp. 42_25_T18]